MRVLRKLLLLSGLVGGAVLPATVSCNVPSFEVLAYSTPGYVIVDDYCCDYVVVDDCCGYDEFWFDWW
ncbi:MAG: hypothetical protein AB7Q17_06470 [Phycisphaerae bacterium]